MKFRIFTRYAAAIIIAVILTFAVVTPVAAVINAAFDKISAALAIGGTQN